MILWKELESKTITKVDLRENFIATQGIVIRALGRVGNYLYLNQENNLEMVIKGIRNLNWSRNASIWRLRAISNNGRIISNNKAAILIGNVIKEHLNLPLSQIENNVEQEHMAVLNR